jgi:hypothetical protein
MMFLFFLSLWSLKINPLEIQFFSRFLLKLSSESSASEVSHCAVELSKLLVEIPACWSASISSTMGRATPGNIDSQNQSDLGRG